MEELETRPNDAPRPKPDGESKQEILTDDPKGTVAVETDMDLKVRIT